MSSLEKQIFGLLYNCRFFERARQLVIFVSGHIHTNLTHNYPDRADKIQLISGSDYANSMTNSMLLTGFLFRQTFIVALFTLKTSLQPLLILVKKPCPTKSTTKFLDLVVGLGTRFCLCGEFSHLHLKGTATIKFLTC